MNGVELKQEDDTLTVVPPEISGGTATAQFNCKNRNHSQIKVNIYFFKYINDNASKS